MVTKWLKEFKGFFQCFEVNLPEIDLRIYITYRKIDTVFT